jgi:SAM-dependent methyltransferase
VARRIGQSLGDGRCSAPAAERNRGLILEVLTRVLPPHGLVLEVGSGTGQHAVHFAKFLPQLVWQPSDPDAECRRSVSSWIRHEGLGNVRQPVALDVRERPWPVAVVDAVVCINVVHVSPWAAMLALLDGTRGILVEEGVLFLYGPYRRRGRATAPSNEKFDAELRAHDPEWGLREVEEVADAAARLGFALREVVDMPANNLSLVFRATRERGAS